MEAPAIGKRVFADGMSGLQHKQSLLSQVVAISTLFLYVGWLTILLGLLIAAFFYRWAVYALIAIFSTLLLPAKPVLWEAFNRHPLFKTWREYFKFSVCMEAEYDPKKKYIFVEYPHGAFPIGPIIAGTLFQTMFPQFPIYSVAADSVFYVPVWRHVIAWIGSLPASRDNFKRLLRKGSVAVVVGGIAEMFMQDAKRERIKMKGRKGFCRIALQEGIDGIVPVFYMGHSQVLGFGPAWLQGVSRKLRTSLGFMYGRWGLPIPRPYPLEMVSGKPVPVPKVDANDPEFESKVDALLNEVIAAMQDLYDRRKLEYGWAHRPLSIE